jgi:hypothetical protein
MLKGFAAVAVVALAGQAGPAPELVAAKVAQLPALDGKADDAAWGQAKELVVKIDVPSELENPRKKISLKAVHDGQAICFLLVWEDKQAHTEHRPWVWNQEKFEYVSDDEKYEDAASLAFALEGVFDPDMMAGVESKWDVWEWGAFRSSTGYARDKWHVYSKSRPEGVKAKRFNDKNEQPLYLARPDDEGTTNFKQFESPAEKKSDKAPQFEAQKPTGSAADVEARGTWADGKWTVEWKRKLNTGNKDDTAFVAGKAVEFAVAVFDCAEKADHEVSGKLVLKIQ